MMTLIGELDRRIGSILADLESARERLPISMSNLDEIVDAAQRLNEIRDILDRPMVKP